MGITEVFVQSTHWFLNSENQEGSVFFQTKSGKLYEAFSYNQPFQANSNYLVEITYISADHFLDNASWNAMFSGNPENEKLLIKTSRNWEYTGLGQIKSITPVIIDFGDFELNTGYWTNDEHVICKYIAFGIDRLDISISGF